MKNIHEISKTQALEMDRETRLRPQPKQRVGLCVLTATGEEPQTGRQDVDLALADLQAVADDLGKPVRLQCEEHRVDRFAVPGGKELYGPQFGWMFARSFANRAKRLAE